HRTISGLGEQLMRSYQLYASTAAGLWISLHHLYRIAKTTGIDQFPVSDELMTHVQQNSCRDAYHRVLLLACANPNKMRQYDVSTVYKLVELWSSHLRLRASEADSDAVFAVNLEQDRPPTPRALIPSSELSNYTDIDLSRLLSALDKQLDGDNEGKSILPIPKGITAPLLSHLINAWGTEYHRAYERVSHKQELQVLVGVSAIHFHLCDGIPFDTFVLGSGKMNLDKDNNPYLHQRHKPEVQIDDDPWSNAFDAEGSGRNFDPLLFSTLDIEKQLVKREREQAAKKFPIQTVQTEDRSHKGYCLHWRKNVPKTLKSGELIALREPDAEHWTLGLVRWVRQNRGSSRLGVELVSAMARPYGASIIHKSGDDVDYLRAFYLPEQKPERPTPCLLTPSVPFQEGQKVRLTQRGQQKTAQLMRKTMETAAISVFAFRPLEGS
ncbi:MAG: hypothetical protein OIF35_13165, partial [Cellvibrionaceae bacterium]|nr:hypothetical protein [Cellvibrionaceae bacterium]